eukprot:9503870-Pyramimonas_sp.AAC.3
MSTFSYPLIITEQCNSCTLALRRFCNTRGGTDARHLNTRIVSRTMQMVVIGTRLVQALDSLQVHPQTTAIEARFVAKIEVFVYQEQGHFCKHALAFDKGCKTCNVEAEASEPGLLSAKCIAMMVLPLFSRVLLYLCQQYTTGMTTNKARIVQASRRSTRSTVRLK